MLTLDVALSLAREQPELTPIDFKKFNLDSSTSWNLVPRIRNSYNKANNYPIICPNCYCRPLLYGDTLYRLASLFGQINFESITYKTVYQYK